MRDPLGPFMVEFVGDGLIELEVRDRVGIARIVLRSLIESEIARTP